MTDVDALNGHQTINSPGDLITGIGGNSEVSTMSAHFKCFVEMQSRPFWRLGYPGNLVPGDDRYLEC